MDLISLVIKLEKEPEAYSEEFKKQIQSFSQMIRLPKQPHKTIRQTLDVLIKFSFVDKEGVAQAIAESVGLCKSYKLKKVILSGLLSLTYKRLISPSTCIRAILEYSSDPSYYINKVKTFIDEESSPIIRQYYAIGNEKQKIFSYYFLLQLYTKYKGNVEDSKVICGGLFEKGKVQRLSFSYFLEHRPPLGEEAREYGRRLYEDIMVKEEREMKILKMRVYVYFKRQFDLKATIIPLALSMIDPEKEDVKELMNIVVDSVTRKELDGVLKSISTHFCSPFKEEDMICYGLNLLRYIYCRFDTTVEGECGDAEFDDSREDDVSDDDTNGDTNEDTNGDNSFIKFLSDSILNYVECFKDSKTKSISYSYRALLNVLKKKKNTGREIDFILRKLSKEERLDLHRKNKESNKEEREMYKAEKKEMKKKKSNRKFKLSKKRMKINAQKRSK